jgi:hypothetical protein
MHVVVRLGTNVVVCLRTNVVVLKSVVGEASFVVVFGPSRKKVGCRRQRREVLCSSRNECCLDPSRKQVGCCRKRTNVVVVVVVDSEECFFCCRKRPLSGTQNLRQLAYADSEEDRTLT